MNTSQRQKLKSQAHKLKPVVLIGANGLTENVIQETDASLQAHELMKVKIYGMERSDRQLCAEQLCAQLGAQLVQMIGNILILYRKNPD